MKIQLTATSLMALSWLQVAQCQAVDPNQYIPTTQCIPADQTSTDFYKFMNHFTGIFYGNFVTDRHYGIYGPLAVGGLASIPEYSVDVRRLANCSARTPTERLGLYAKTLQSPATLRIYGDLDTGNNPGFLQFISENFNCKVLNQFDVYNFKFDDLWPSAIQMSSFLASQVATHALRADGSVDEVYHTEDQRFYIFHFGPCDSTGCQDAGNYVSDASQILLGSGNWQGPTNGYPQGRMIVFNEMSITTARPSSGLSGCRVIYNFYPINTATSAIDTTAQITIHRLTSDKMEGLVMNLYGPIYDGPQGNFAGQLVGKSYQWEDPTQGANIMDYEDDCYGKFNCWIPTNFTDPYSDLYTTVATETATSTSLTRTTVNQVSTDFSATTTATRTILIDIDAIDVEVSHSVVVLTELDTVTVTETFLNVLTLVSTSTASADDTTSTTTYITLTNQVIETERPINSTSTQIEEETSYLDQDTTTTTTTTQYAYSVEEQTTTTTTTIVQLVD
ncbi:hypothetical protein FB192DRAFT_1432570 [Mucor lusitanicus]|uniref:Uncharacterized protein n=1 Tax=Mucor circinelloides f. lusitanicus TaxID=29924 RepID=A0A8H4BSJ8_MUCCL|nr:hypothetical protein FB192DRAFT_1432570 [Mucor lusitanicus]